MNAVKQVHVASGGNEEEEGVKDSQEVKVIQDNLGHRDLLDPQDKMGLRA